MLRKCMCNNILIEKKNPQKVLTETNCKPNKIWVDKGSKFYSR